MFYGWFIAALGALIIALGSAPVFYGLPVWNPVVRNAFGWTATQMSGAYAITQVQEGFLGPVAGFLTEKLGARRMVLIGMAVLGLGFVLFSRVQELWQFYAAFCVISLGSSLGTWLPVMTALRGHYFGREGFAAISGLSMAPMNILLFVAPLATGFMRDAIGDYTAAFLTIAGISLAGSCLFLMLPEPPGRPTRAAAGSRQSRVG